MALPEHIGRYEVLNELGRGGQSIVYLCRDPRTHKAVAVKLLDRSDPLLARRLQREIDVLDGLHHPNIVDVRDVGEYEGRPYFAMRCYQGGNLRSVLFRDERVSVGAAVGVLRLIGDALGSAHRDGIVHRDVKPSNVLFDRGGHAYLADFGIAMVTGGEPLTQTGDLVGTIGYMAPECLAGQPQTAAADAYGLGAMGWQMMTGSLPPQTNSSDAPSLQNVAPFVGLGIAQAIESLLNPDPLKRPNDLCAWAAGFGTGVVVEPIVPAQEIMVPHDIMVSGSSVAQTDDTVVTPVASAMGTASLGASSRSSAARNRKRIGAVLAAIAFSGAAVGVAFAFNRNGNSPSVRVRFATTIRPTGTASPISGRNTTMAAGTGAQPPGSTDPTATVAPPAGNSSSGQCCTTGGTTGTQNGNVPTNPTDASTAPPVKTTRTTTTLPPPATFPTGGLFNSTVSAAGPVFLGGNGSSAQTCDGSHLSSAGAPSFVGLQGSSIISIRASGTIWMGDLPIQGAPQNTVDGGSGVVSVADMNGLAGVVAYPRGALVGAFVNATSSTAVPNPFSYQPNATVLRPNLNQVFFVGDGTAAGGTAQQFQVPGGATRLVLGFVDGPFPNAGADHNCPWYYKDNTGAASMQVTRLL